MQNLESRIKEALFKKGWTIKKLCGEIEITENGFKKMLDNNSMKVETLEKIAFVLGVPVYFFFESEKAFHSAIGTGNIAGNFNSQKNLPESEQNKELEKCQLELIQALKRESELKDRIIQLLEKR